MDGQRNKLESRENEKYVVIKKEREIERMIQESLKVTKPYRE